MAKNFTSPSKERSKFLFEDVRLEKKKVTKNAMNALLSSTLLKSINKIVSNVISKQLVQEEIRSK